MFKLGFDKWVIVLTVTMAALLQTIDSSIVNVTLNQMMGNLGASLGDISWVVTGYAAASAVMITMSGWLTSKLGRRNYFAASIVMFTIASIFCGTSTNVWELVFFRVVQGIGGGGLLTTAQSILIQTFPKEDIGIANAIFGMGVIIGPSIGPTLGGYITDNLSWNWVFYINIPFGILATFLTYTYIKEPAEKVAAGKMDWLALILLIMGIGGLQIILEKGEEKDWFDSRFIVGMSIAAGVGLIGFIWRQLAVKIPILDLRLLLQRRFAVGTLFNFILGFGLFASVFIIPVFCQTILGFTASQTGLLLMPGSIATGLMMPIVGGLLSKNYISPIWYAAIGFLMFFGFCFDLSAISLVAGPDYFFWPLIVRGIGMGLIFIPLTTITLSDLKNIEIPQGSALTGMIRQLGGTFGTAIMTTYISTRTMFHASRLGDNVSIYNPFSVERIKQYTGLFLSKGDALMAATSKAYGIMQGAVMKQALVMTYADAFLVIGGFFLVCVPLLLLFIGKKIEAPAHTEMVME
ncbi:DHA2 family efflux MFS transporter permease subunit [Spirosoma endophyticum]|uniref:MFS transporter, DHA2 family, multidrug resistance protein n=1 Tax=Spirosoma endophyticum TaxID=662367 RepID=A0A1I1KPI4_9BACT|nr:DHA2 family efflux MFS transporter permease subunit [Spirosoma endophyticum]SFC62766.1 MFS transporter, DHA2 family, multidrug resistance protein [Spirosoma endophyticum]